MPIYSPTGFLDITNATLRTSNTECQNLKIGTGNLYVTSEISPSFELNLSNVTSLGATSPHTLTLSNVTTAIDATSNIITSGNLKIGGLIYTKDWGFREVAASNNLYVGRFTAHGITEVLIIDQGANLGSASKFTITRNAGSPPLVNGIDSSSTVNYEWYYTEHDTEIYHLWVRPSVTVQTNIKVTSSTYTEVDAPTSPTLTACTNGLINMSGNIVASQNLTVTGKVEAGYLYGDGSNISGISSNLDQIVNIGNVTSNTVQFTNATTGLVTTANVEVGGELTVSGNVAVNDVLLVSKTWTKEIPYQVADGSTSYIYIGCFRVDSAVEVEINDSGNSLGASSKFTVTKHYSHTPFVSGHRGSRYVVHKFYWAPGNDTNVDYHLWHQPSISTSPTGQYRIRYKTAMVLDQAENVSGRVECNYGLFHEENGFGTYVSIPFSLSFDGSSWYTVTNAGSHLSTGTWAVQVNISSAGLGSGQLYDETYSGVFTWYAGTTNNTASNNISLHNAGHAANAEIISMRTRRQGHPGTNLLFQINSNMNWSGAVRSTTFHFRRLI